MSFASFRFEGVDTRDGSMRTGSIRATSLIDARQRLASRHVAASQLEQVHRFNTRLSDQIDVLDSLYLLLKSKVELTQALDIVRLQSDRMNRTQQKINDVCEKVKKGSSFSASLKETGLVSDPFVLALIRSGEDSGSLDKSLHASIYFLKTVQGIRSKVISASLYPAIVVIVAIIAVFILTRYVVPIFVGMYTRFGTEELPWITTALMSTVTWLRSYGGYLVLSLAILALIFLMQRSHPLVQRAKDSLLRNIPVVRSMYADLQGFQCFHSLNILTSSGVELVDALSMLQGMFGMTRFGQQLAEVEQSVLRGGSFHDGLKRSGFSSGSTLSILRSGEMSGNLKDSFDLLSHYYQDRFEKAVSRVQTIIEPLFIVVISMVVGLVLVAMYLPMFNIVNVM